MCVWASQSEYQFFDSFFSGDVTRVCLNDNNFINTFQPDDANRQTHILHKIMFSLRAHSEREENKEKICFKTHCEVLRWIVIFVKKHTYFVVISEVSRFAQNLDEFLHIFHRLLIRFPANLLQVQRDKLRSGGFDMRQKFRDPIFHQSRRLRNIKFTYLYAALYAVCLSVHWSLYVVRSSCVNFPTPVIYEQIFNRPTLHSTRM